MGRIAYADKRCRDGIFDINVNQIPYSIIKHENGCVHVISYVHDVDCL